MKKTSAVLFLTALFAAVLSGAGSRAAADDPTFNNQVVRIFQRNCQTCHHPGDVAPFSLMTYRDARPWARSIQEKVVLKQMPPWKPVAGCSEFQGERILADDEISTISRWVDAGSPEGDPADLPPPLTFTDGWPLGPPDAVLQPEGDYTVRPGNDIYRCFSIPTDGRGDRYISAVEIKPGDRNVVHHVIIFLDPTGVSKALDDADAEPGYTSFGGPGFDAAGIIGGWAPGSRSRFENDGTAWKIPSGARVVIQVHYHPRDIIETDRTQIGLYYARQPVRKEIGVLPLINENFTIPAGDPHYRVTAGFPAIPPGYNAHALAVAPHMHLLGREISVSAAAPNGTSTCLVNINDWSFQWQGFYYFKEPVPLTAGTRLSAVAYYDNTSNNPRNPNSPPKAVRWGEQTTDEMCVAFITYTLDAENLDVSSPAINGVSADGGQLTVTGRGFLKGADIEIDGHRLTDCRNVKKSNKRITSGDAWQALAPAGKQVSVTVLNTDGVRSTAMSFTR